ncbi:MAG: hypothetical protein IKW89_10095 [Bacteroidales bacterium]|nr:hypothetical protein [Bacteroidales bacterium]
MEATHAFIKGARGNGIFYRLEDFLVFFTIVSVTVREMGLKILGFCPMFNHIHFLIKGISVMVLRSFIQRVTFLFVKEYNQDYERTGPVFNSPFGKSIKKGIKVILGCVAYIFNNPVAGKMHKTAMDYRWNLLAYYKNPHPFSKKLRKDHCRNVMRTALRKVDYFFSKGKYLSYGALHSIFEGLDKEEGRQITDYIINKYNFLAYDDLIELYGSFEKMTTALESNAGSEFDLEDEYGDHSCYREMLRVVNTLGYKGILLNFERLSPDARDSIFWVLRNQTGAKAANINKFLHINQSCYGSD